MRETRSHYTFAHKDERLSLTVSLGVLEQQALVSKLSVHVLFLIDILLLIDIEFFIFLQVYVPRVITQEIDEGSTYSQTHFKYLIPAQFKE